MAHTEYIIQYFYKNYTELTVSRFWTMSLEAAQLWRRCFQHLVALLVWLYHQCVITWFKTFFWTQLWPRLQVKTCNCQVFSQFYHYVFSCVALRFFTLLYLKSAYNYSREAVTVRKTFQALFPVICHALDQDRHRETWAIDELFISFNPKGSAHGVDWGWREGFLPLTCVGGSRLLKRVHPKPKTWRVLETNIHNYSHMGSFWHA